MTTTDLIAELQRDSLGYCTQALLLRQHYRRVLPRLAHVGNACVPYVPLRLTTSLVDLPRLWHIIERISHEQQ